ncbi:MAG TPA: hypothetical protein DEQ61_19415 [Streptomyces sp.]|nr:hypothetical protein [Streptomyces sp.]
MRTNLNRMVGAATALYSLAIMVKPMWLAKPCRLTMGPDGSVPADTRLLIKAIGARDTAIGLAMLTAGSTQSRREATACRIAADAADAAVFGALLDDRRARVKVAAFALAWSGLSAFTLCGPGHRGSAVKK